MIDIFAGTECLSAVAEECILLKATSARFQDSVFRSLHAGVHDASDFMNETATRVIPTQSLDIPPDDGMTCATVDLAE